MMDQINLNLECVQMANKEKQGNLSGGLLLVLLGVFFLLWQLSPAWFTRIFGERFPWPVFVIGLGGVFLLAAILGRSGGLAVPGTILAGIGGILYYQNVTGDWASWAYIWSLIPGFVGLGMVISSFLNGGERGARRVGTFMFVISVLAFVVIWSLFTANLNFNLVWPAVMILAGLALLVRSLMRGR